MAEDRLQYLERIAQEITGLSVYEQFQVLTEEGLRLSDLPAWEYVEHDPGLEIVIPVIQNQIHP